MSPAEAESAVTVSGLFTLTKGSGRELAMVYVPTTPNPTSGYLEVVPVNRLTPTDWTVDQAMALIISGGAVSPGEIPFEVALSAAGDAAASVQERVARSDDAAAEPSRQT